MACRCTTATDGIHTPYEGTLNELVDLVNTDLCAWAAAWPDTPS